MGDRQVSEALVLVIGAGPAGLYTAHELAERGAQVVLLNRDIRPGGLAEYGIYHSKHKTKAILRAQFQKILQNPRIHYLGNVTVGQDGDLTLAQLRELGFAAIVVAVGAQGTKWLGLPGEELRGVYHAKDLIYYYNGLPPFSERTYEIGKRIALIGVGNVMADIAHWLVCDLKVDEVVAVARRGPAEVKFTRQELTYFAANLDVDGLNQEIRRVSARMESVGQDPEAARTFILAALSGAAERVADTRVRFLFLASPARMLGDTEGRVCGLVVDDTELVLDETGDTRAKRLGTTQTLDVDTVIFCIGDRVSDELGLPVQWFSYVKNPEPAHPVGGISYEAYDPDACAAIDGVFVVGWARSASEGQVALARKDARGCADAVAAYVAGSPSGRDPEAVQALMDILAKLDKPIVTAEDALCLARAEAAQADACGDPGFRFTSNAEMLAALTSGDD
jgi:ferredoxin--NADP+ reductase